MSSCSLFTPKFLSFIVFFVVLLKVKNANSVILRAYISQHGLHGEIEFSQKNTSLISIRTNLKPTLQFPDQVWKWSIHEYPVNYNDITSNRCNDDNLGKELIDLTEEIGFLIIPGKENTEFESNNAITGSKGLWGKSLVLKTVEENRIICASLMSTEKSAEKFAVARFNSPVAGDLVFRWLHTKEFGEKDSFIMSDLYHARAVTDKTSYTEHKWKILATDVFDSDKNNQEENCNSLQVVFDPEDSETGKSVGDLDHYFGLIKVATDGSKEKFKALYKGDIINVLRSEMEVTKRNLYIMIYDQRDSNTYMACAKLRLMEPKSAKSIINMDGIKGKVEFNQRSPYDITWINFQLTSSDNTYESNLRFVSSMERYVIKELPVVLIDGWDSICNSTGGIYNPLKLEMDKLPPAGLGTQDQYPIGDLFGKNNQRTEYLNHQYLLPGLANEMNGIYWDVLLPMFGEHSVLHRAVVLERRTPSHPVCGTIHQYDHETDYQVIMNSAEVIFRYPLVGKVILRQPFEKPWEDTTIIIESMVHADGSNVNNTFEHRWAIHANAPGKDFYNWTARCLSAGQVFSPHIVDLDNRHPEQYCISGLQGLCRWGDLSGRHGLLSIAGSKKDSMRLTRRLFTDSMLALSGKNSVLRKSMVIYDDHGPVARGERMACSLITGLHRRKAVVRDWFGNGESVSLGGRMELTQESPYDIVNAFARFERLDQKVSTYNIHVVPVQRELEFPCEKTSLYDTFNPFNIDKTRVPPPTLGSIDQYELGDLSGKYGLLDGHRTFNTVFNDTQMSLYGPHSILGRSVVIHKKVGKNPHWACSSIERGYSPSEARELRGIVSFHHPAGFAWGYIRMTQLIHNDGSASDTVLEVNLRYPGDRDLNKTNNHNWEIFVNPVGVDAAVKVTGTRCVAGGYRWNPYFTQLADPLNRDLYNRECGADNPLRCDVGDLTARLGTINIGSKRQMFMDSNFPLEGPVTAMGRSIVIFGPERSSERFACANIVPDKDIIKYVNIMKPPRFVLSQFLEQVRNVLGIPPWMLGVDSRQTKTLHQGSCIQILLHFTGPIANQIELDFARLLASGRLESPSLFIPGHVDQKRKKTISYRQCSNTDGKDKKKSSSFFSIRSAATAGRYEANLLSHSLLLILMCFSRLLL